MMRCHLGFAFVFSLFVTPAVAEGPIAAHLEVGGGVLNLPAFGELKAVDVAGRFNVAFGNGWNTEIEVNFDSRFNAASNWSITYPVAHVWHRAREYAAGVLGGVAFPSNPGGSIAFVGVEGEAYFNDATTIGGQAIYSVFWPGGCCVADFVTLRGWVEQYFAPNTKGVLSAAVFLPQGLFTQPITQWFVEGLIEHRFTDTPLSGFALARHVRHGGGDGWLGMIGVRFFTDREGNTLRRHDLEVPWNVVFPVMPTSIEEPG